MINSNPETVCTDYDTSDLLFFEPLTLEDMLNVIERLNGGGRRRGRTARAGSSGAIVQFGGQTPLNLAHGLVAAGVPLIGTSLDVDRPGRGPRPVQGDARRARARAAGQRHRPLARGGGRDRRTRSATRCSCARATCSAAGAWRRASTRPPLRRYMRTAVDVSELADAPVLIDRFLSEAIEVDVDVVADFDAGRGAAPAARRPSRRPWSAASWSTSRRRASTPATRRARSRRSRCPRRISDRDQGATPGGSPSASTCAAS